MFLRVAVPQFAYSAVNLMLATVQAAHECTESVFTSETVLLLTRWDYFAEHETGLPQRVQTPVSSYTMEKWILLGGN